MSRLLIGLSAVLIAVAPLVAAETPQETAERLARLIDNADDGISRREALPPAASKQELESIQQTPGLAERSDRMESTHSRSRGTGNKRQSSSQSILERHRTTPLPRVFGDKIPDRPTANRQLDPDLEIRDAKM